MDTEQQMPAISIGEVVAVLITILGFIGTIALIRTISPNFAHMPPGTTDWLVARLAIGVYALIGGVAVIAVRVHTTRASLHYRLASHPGWLMVTGGVILDGILLIVERYPELAAISGIVAIVTSIATQMFVFALKR
ncbi:MAG: hypothetical protein OJF49_001935 [Ktedonobacterales bacterium]|jgi:hypothetical protein|nr:MAG: hypothetical protein OJF49_001935 [Ktedonobacterales bacterium]